MINSQFVQVVQRGDAIMIYLLEFLGLLGVAILLAVSPLLIRLVEIIVPRGAKQSRSTAPHASTRVRSEERSEIRDEISRMTTMLELERRDVRGNSPSPVETHSWGKSTHTRARRSR